MSATDVHRDSQGDTLNAKKLERKGLVPSGAAATAAHARGASREDVHTTDAASSRRSDGESRLPAVAKPPAAPAGHAVGDEGSPASELVRTQLRMAPPPLPPPPVREDDMEGTAGSYFATRERTGGVSPKPPPQPSSRASTNAVTRGLPLKKGDYYFRPDLDAVSQRVVLMSLAEQQEQERAQKDFVARRREVIMAKFEALRRDRILLEVEAGLPVSDKKREEYGITGGDAHATKLRRSQAKKRAQNIVRREEILEHTREVEQPRVLEAARHRAEMMNSIRNRREVRLLKEEMLGTGTCATFKSSRNAAPLASTIAEVNANFVDAHRRGEEAADVHAALSELDKFDEALFSELCGPKKPRQRDLPYELSAPHKHIPAHRAPIILTDDEKKQALSH